MRFSPLRSPEDILHLVQEVGFLPFFSSRIPGFSMENGAREPGYL